MARSKSCDSGSPDEAAIDREAIIQAKDWLSLIDPEFPHFARGLQKSMYEAWCGDESLANINANGIHSGFRNPVLQQIYDVCMIASSNPSAKESYGQG